MSEINPLDSGEENPNTQPNEEIQTPEAPDKSSAESLNTTEQQSPQSPAVLWQRDFDFWGDTSDSGTMEEEVRFGYLECSIGSFSGNV